MQRTFDIRFARATGLAGILEAPANTFRWRGAASLSIDETGLEIEPKRGLQTLLARRARFRINTADLREVSRAADALRIEFGMPGTRRAVVPFWVNDADTAAEIMRLVPTRRTIETDEPVTQTTKRGRWNSATVWALIVGIGGVIAWRMLPVEVPRVVVGDALPPTSAPAAPVVDETPRTDPAAPVDAPAPRAAPESSATQAGTTAGSAEATVPSADPPTETTTRRDVAPVESAPAVESAAARTGIFVAGDPMYETASRQFDLFQDQAAHFYVRFLDGATPPSELAAAWDHFAETITGSAEYRDSRLRPMIDDELSAAASWSRALTAYADATRSHDPARISAARADLERASDQTTRVALHIERR